MSEILCQWLNQELKVSQTVTPKSFAKAFSNGYLIGEVLHKFDLQEDFSEFSESRISSAKLNNFSRLEPTLHRLGVQFDQNLAQNIITEKPGVATKLLYQLYIILQRKKKSGLTGVEAIQSMGNTKFQSMRSESFRDRIKNLIPRQTDFNLMKISERFQEKYSQKNEDLTPVHAEKLEKTHELKEDQRSSITKKQRLSKRRQNEIMAQIQAAIIQIPKPTTNRTLKALEVQKMMKKKKEAEDVANEIKKFEALIKKDLQAKESASKTTVDTTTDLLNTYSDDDYIKKIQKRLEEDAFAREQREKRRRRLLMDQLIAHEAQEEAYREEQLINRLMRQSQQERRIAVQLMHVRHEKEVLWQNRIFREKQYEERRLRDFQDALDREAALAKQAKIDFQEQAQKEREIHAQIAVERAQANYDKHYKICEAILDQILDLSTKVADYRLLTNNLIPHKLMQDWKQLFFSGKPIYEQASIKSLSSTPTAEQLIELEKSDLLDSHDYDEYKNMVGEWALPEEMTDNVPASNNSILGHVIHRLVEKSHPPKAEANISEVPSFAIKGCLLGKTFSGKTTALKALQKEFPIHILSIDTLVQEAIQAYLDNETETKALPDQEEETVQDVIQGSGEGGQDPQAETEANEESKTKLNLYMNICDFPEVSKGRSTDEIPNFTVRAKLGAKSEKLLKKGKSIPDMLLVSMMVNAINQIPADQGWILDGFPMTLNQAKLLEEALTGCNRMFLEHERKKMQISTLAIDPTASTEVPLPPSAFDFVILLDVSDNSSLNRMNDLLAEAFAHEVNHHDTDQPVAADNTNAEGDETVRAQIQHRIVGFLDNWPLLEKWFTEPRNILKKINADVEKESLCQKIKELFITELAKKENEVKKKLEESEKKEAHIQSEPSSSTPTTSPETEKAKSEHHERAKSVTKGKTAEHQHVLRDSSQEGKGKKGETALKRKGSPKGKPHGGKVTVKKSPTDVSPTSVGPPIPKPGSEDWVYVNEHVPEEICSYLVPYWELIESSYIKSIKTVLRYLREDQHSMVAYLYNIRTSFQQFLRRPDHKQNFVAQWQTDFNSLPADLWDDEETKAELHQRVNDLRDRLWDICDARKEEAEQECLDIINESWLQDLVGITMNHFFSLMQAEVNRFQDTKRFLQDYYRGMESRIPTDDNKKFYRVPLVQLDATESAENQLKIPLVPRISISPESPTSKPRTKSLVRDRIDSAIESVESNLEADEKLVMDTWQQASSIITQMVAAEHHQRVLDEEKDNLPLDTKEKSPPAGPAKKVKKETPKGKKEEKKGKGKSPPVSVTQSPVVISPEELAELEKKSELKLKIKEEHFAALQSEEVATQFRLELIKTKALCFLGDIVKKAIELYKLMDKWFGERFLKEMASVEKLMEVARYHIETSTKIQYELYLVQDEFFISGDTKVFPDPPPPIRPPPVEKEEDGTLTIEQLDCLREQFLVIAPKGRAHPDGVGPVPERQKRPWKLDQYLPKRNNQFLKIWLKKYPWLVYDELLNLMFCGLCRKHGVKTRGSQVSFFYGTDNFRTEFINAHHLSEAHAKASLMEATSGSPVNRATTELMVKTMSKVTLGRVENLFRSCHALAKTGRPLEDFIWMCNLDDMKGVDIGPVFRTNKSARTFTYFIAEVERRTLREKLDKSKFFSVISDGVTDDYSDEAELVYVQFAYAGKVHCQIVGVQTLERKDPLAIKNAIERTLERNLQLRLSNQDWAKKLVGFGSDCDPNSDENRVALLLREIQPCVLTVYCFAHHLELSYRIVLHSIPLYKDVRDLLHGIYHFYHDSPRHKSSLVTAFKDLHLQPVMPSQIGGQRWLQELQAALQNILKGYPAIVQQLHSVEEGTSEASYQKAKELLQLLLQADIIKFVHFLVDVINVLGILSRVNQNRNSSIADIFATLESTLEMLRIYQTRPGPKERKVDSVTHFHGNCLGGKGNISDVRNTLLTFLIKRLQDCFRDASQDVVKATMIGSFKLWPVKINQEFGEKEVSILTAHYEPVLEAAKVKIDEVDTEWSMLKLEIYARFQNIRKLTWDFVNSVYFHKYPNILTLMDLVLTLPASSAETERGFSQMKHTKSQMHAKIKADSLTDLLIIQLNSPDINNFDPRKAIHLWNTRTPSTARNTRPYSDSSSSSESHYESILSNKAFVDIVLDLVTLNLGANFFPSMWMHLTQAEMQELTSLLVVNSESVDWRKFLLVAALPWPIPMEEELLATLQRFKAVDEQKLGTVTFEQYMQAGLWFKGDEQVKIPENPLAPLPFNRHEHLIEFFFRLFADYNKMPPQLDYTQMLLYFACHPNAVEGVYRALSVAIGTHVTPRVKAPVSHSEKAHSSNDMTSAEEAPEAAVKASEERELEARKGRKEVEITAKANTAKISMEILCKVFRGGNEALDSSRFSHHLKTDNIYSESFMKVFKDLGAKNLEPLEVTVLLKHPFIEDLISSYSEYKIPDIKAILQRSEHIQGIDRERSPSRHTEEKK